MGVGGGVRVFVFVVSLVIIVYTRMGVIMLGTVKVLCCVVTVVVVGMAGGILICGILICGR